MGRRLQRVGAWAEPYRLLGAIQSLVPEVMQTLEAILTPHRRSLLELLVHDDCLLDSGRTVHDGAFPVETWAWSSWQSESIEHLVLFKCPLPPEKSATCARIVDLNGEIDAWARRWNIHSQWVLRTAALTLYRWETRRAFLGAKRCFEILPWSGYSHPKRTPRIDTLFRESLDQADYRARDKHLLGDDLELLWVTGVPQLVAFVHWQVLGKGIEQTREVWRRSANMKTLPNKRGVINMMHRLVKAFQFEPRALARPGRRRRG